MDFPRSLQPLRKCLDMIPRHLRLRLLMAAPLNLVVATFESASAGGIYFLVKVVGDPDALHSMLVGSLVQRIFPDATHRTLVLTFTALLGAFYVVKVIFTMWATITSRRALKHANVRVASMFFRAYLRAPYSAHFKRNSAELTSQINRVIPETMDGIVTAYTQLFLELVVGLGLLVTMCVASPYVTAGLVGFTGLSLFVLLRWTSAHMLRSGEIAHKMIKQQARKVVEGLGAIKEVKVLGRERYFLDEYGALVAQAQEMQLRRSVLDAIPRVVIEAVFASAGLFAIALYTLSHSAGGNVVPLLGLYAYGAFRLIPTANRLSLAFGELRWRRAALDKIYDEYREMNVAEEIDFPLETTRTPLDDRLVFENVSFSYGEEAPFALSGLSFEVQRGRSCGIVGPTGAGKSTVIDLILGLLTPTGGRITVDGQDIEQLGVRWRKSVGYVPQEIFLCDDTIRRNVALGVPAAQVDDARVWSALTMAQLDGFVRTLPGELDAEVGERGARLSGGQRQRIGIARALYHDPTVLVFDEATSSLDVSTEADVTRAIESLLGIKTVIVVAHRLSTVRRCDRLLLLVDGKLRASGSYDELVRDEPLFRKMALGAAE